MRNQFLQLLTFCLIGFTVVLLISLISGTSSYNKYCLQAQAGDWSGALARYGPDHSGFLGCRLNSLVLSFPILFFGVYILQYLAQIYLITMLNRRKYLMHMWVTIVFIFLLVSLSYLASAFFPHLSGNFLEGQVMLSREPVMPIPSLITASELASFSLEHALTLFNRVVYTFLFLFSGPLTGIWFLNNYAKRLKLKPGRKLFIFILLVSLTIHVLVMGILQIVVFWNWKKQTPLVEIQTESPFEREVFEYELPTQEPKYIKITLVPQEKIYGE